MIRKDMNFSLTENHVQMLKELAESKGFSCSYLLRRWIERTYKKYSQKKEQSQDGTSIH